MTAALAVSGLRVDGEAGVLLEVGELVVESGAIAVVVGPTDSGKTLLAAVLSGLVQATAGRVHVAGRRLTGSPAERRRLGLAATVSSGARITGCTVGEALRLAGSRRAGAALERFAALERRAGVRAELLSGGEQQMLQVACAWCAAPRVLVLDAPTTGLAEEAAELVRRLARDAAADGAAVLWLDQSETPAPVAASWQLDAGVLSSAPPAASPTAPA